MAAPAVIVFDVNETLSDMSPLRGRFSDVGAPASLAQTWFAAVLRDGFALAAAGGMERFAVLGEQLLRSLLPATELDRPLDDAVQHVMGGFSELPLHPDVVPGVRALGSHGMRLVTLSNGAAAVADRLLTDGGLRGSFEALLSVEDAGIWKPHPDSYRYAARSCGVELSQMMLVAVHPWDIDGAARAGMSTAWVNRGAGRYPSYATQPTLTVTSLTDLADQLTE